MSHPLIQNTAGQVIELGMFLDSTNGDTEETALTIANTDILLWKNGATSLVAKNSGGATHMSRGVYQCTLNATDTNTLGSLTIYVHVAGALVVKAFCTVMTAANYNAAVLGTGVSDVNVISISGDTTAADNLEAATDGTGYNVGNGAIVTAQVTGGVGGDVAGQVLGALTHTGTAQAGAATTITLDVTASAVDDFYVNQLLVIQAGTGAGQARFVTDYVGATKIATVATWATTPDATSVFALLPFGAIAGASAPTASQVADEVQTRTIAAVTLVNGLGANAVNAAALAADAGVEIAAAVRTNLATELGRIDAAVTTRASQMSVDDLPTNTELATALSTETVLANVKQINDVPLVGDGSIQPWGPA